MVINKFINIKTLKKVKRIMTIYFLCQEFPICCDANQMGSTNEAIKMNNREVWCIIILEHWFHHPHSGVFIGGIVTVTGVAAVVREGIVIAGEGGSGPC
jgi:hypothetical protein